MLTLFFCFHYRVNQRAIPQIAVLLIYLLCHSTVHIATKDTFYRALSAFLTFRFPRRARRLVVSAPTTSCSLRAQLNYRSRCLSRRLVKLPISAPKSTAKSTQKLALQAFVYIDKNLLYVSKMSSLRSDFTC